MIHLFSLFCRYSTTADLLTATNDLLLAYSRGTTSTDDAMQMIQDPTLYFPGGPGDRLEAVNVVLVITDGVPYPADREPRALQLAQSAQDLGIMMFAVGITDAIKTEVLQQLSSQPRQKGVNYFESPGFDVLEEISHLVAQQTCRGAEVTPPPGKCKNK